MDQFSQMSISEPYLLDKHGLARVAQRLKYRGIISQTDLELINADVTTSGRFDKICSLLINSNNTNKYTYFLEALQHKEIGNMPSLANRFCNLVMTEDTLRIKNNIDNIPQDPQ